MAMPKIEVEITRVPGVSFHGLQMGDEPNTLRISLRDYLSLPNQVTGQCPAKFRRRCGNHWHEMEHAEILHVVMMGLALIL